MTDLEIKNLLEHYLILREEYDMAVGEKNRYVLKENFTALGHKIATFVDIPVYLNGSVIIKAYYWKDGKKLPTLQLFTEESYKKYLNFKEKSAAH